MRIQYELLTTGEMKNKSDLGEYSVIIDSSMIKAQVFKNGAVMTVLSGSSRHKLLKAIKEFLITQGAISNDGETRAKRK